MYFKQTAKLQKKSLFAKTVFSLGAFQIAFFIIFLKYPVCSFLNVIFYFKNALNLICLNFSPL